jgi:hypothetical protein
MRSHDVMSTALRCSPVTARKVDPTSHHLFLFWIFIARLAQAHGRASAIFVDELDARDFKRPPSPPLASLRRVG